MEDECSSGVQVRGRLCAHRREEKIDELTYL